MVPGETREGLSRLPSHEAGGSAKRLLVGHDSWMAESSCGNPPFHLRGASTSFEMLPVQGNQTHHDP